MGTQHKLAKTKPSTIFRRDEKGPNKKMASTPVATIATPKYLVKKANPIRPADANKSLR